MQCHQCGEQVLREAVFCHRCGARTDADAEPQNATSVERDSHDNTRDGFENKPRSSTNRLRDAATSRSRDTGGQEMTLWEGGYSSKAMLSRWLLSTLATVGLIVVGVGWPRREIWLAIAAIVVLLWTYQFLVLVSRRWSVHYRLTNQRFIHQLGILRRVTDRIELIDVTDITFEQGMIDRLTGVGSIHISSNDQSHPELTLDGIDDVAHVAGILDETYRAERRRRGLLIENL